MQKKAVPVICVLLLIALLIPIPNRLKDGGTVRYNAGLYSVELCRRLNPEGSGQEYQKGTIVKILGVEVFNSVT